MARNTKNITSEIDTTEKATFASVFGFDLTPKAPVLDMAIGEHVVRLVPDKNGDVLRDLEQPYQLKNNKGDVNTVTQVYVLTFQDVKTGETSEVEVPACPIGETKFLYAMNYRSGNDLYRKLNSVGLQLIQMGYQDLKKYLTKFPVRMRYESRSYVDEATNEMRHGKYKLQIWNPEDFQSRSNRK